MMGVSELRPTFNRYYDNQVSMRRAHTKEVIDRVMPIINQILKGVSAKDPRFSSEANHAGSYWQRLKIKNADEFDLCVPLCGLGTYHWSGEHRPRYYNFNRPIDGDLETFPDDIKVVTSAAALPPPPHGYSRIPTNSTQRMWTSTYYPSLEFDDDIIPFLVRRQYRKCVLEVLRETGLRGNVILSRKKHGPAITVNIKLAQLEHAVSVDFTPVIETKLSFQQSHGFPANAKWLARGDKMEQLTKDGMDVVAKGEFDWKYSYVKCESTLLTQIDADGGCRKKALRIMKALHHDFWANSSKPALSTYHLKTLLFWECEAETNSHSWQPQQLANRILCMTRKLRDAMCQKNLTSFFDQNVNLMAKCDRDQLQIEIAKIDEFLLNPKQLLERKVYSNISMNG